MPCRTFLAPLLAACLAAVPLAARAVPEITHWQLANGASVHWVQTRALPMLDIEVAFAAGSAFEPAERAGLAELAAELLPTGADGLSEQQIADRLADTGAQLDTHADTDRASLTLRTLSEPAQRDAALALAAQILATPTYAADVVKREKGRAIETLKDARTRPAALAGEALTRALYGATPYGHVATEDTLAAITPVDLREFHHRLYTADNARITIVGQATREEAQKIAEQLTAHLPRGERLVPPAGPSAVTEDAAGKTERIANPSSQAHILIGQPLLTRTDPDYYPLLVGNYVLGGGGFVSRLTTEVREKNGLAYSIASYLEPRTAPGPFVISLQTRGRQADTALKIVRDVVQDFLANGVRADELKAAQDNLVNGFGLKLDSNAKIRAYVAMIAFYDLPDNWLEMWPKKVAAVTVEEVQDAWRRRLHADQLATIVAGGEGDTDEHPAPPPQSGTESAAHRHADAP